jgi:fatty acid desaturase
MARTGPAVASTPWFLPPEHALEPLRPTPRLGPDGRPLGTFREQLRRIPDLRNALTVAGVWLQSVGVIAAAVVVDHPAAWLAAFLLMGRAFALFAILAHESAHRLLFTRKALNDAAGRWLLAYPAFVPLDVYRRVHMAHHRDELGPAEPDTLLYAGYPIERASWRRKLLRDAVGISGWKNLKGLGRGLRNPVTRPVALRIVGVQALLLGAATAVGRPELYLLLWLAPWLTVWRVLNRLRAVAEHGGMVRSEDRRRTTHVIRQHALARFWMVPYRTGWHLAHHVDPGVPFRNLPVLHRELEAAGYLTDAVTWPSYRSFWRACVR